MQLTQMLQISDQLRIGRHRTIIRMALMAIEALEVDRLAIEQNLLLSGGDCTDAEALDDAVAIHAHFDSMQIRCRWRPEFEIRHCAFDRFAVCDFGVMPLRFSVETIVHLMARFRVVAGEEDAQRDFAIRDVQRADLDAVKDWRRR